MNGFKQIAIIIVILSISASVCFAYSGVTKWEKLDDRFDNANVVYYDGTNGIGINHIAYWTITDEDIDLIFDGQQAAVEKAKKA